MNDRLHNVIIRDEKISYYHEIFAYIALLLDYEKIHY